MREWNKKKLTPGQSILDFMLAFLAIALLSMGIVRIWTWFNVNYTGRQLAYQRSRLTAGTPIDNYSEPVNIGADDDGGVYEPLDLTEDWVFTGTGSGQISTEGSDWISMPDPASICSNDIQDFTNANPNPDLRHPEWYTVHGLDDQCGDFALHPECCIDSETGGQCTAATLPENQTFNYNSEECPCFIKCTCMMRALPMKEQNYAQAADMMIQAADLDDAAGDLHDAADECDDPWEMCWFMDFGGASEQMDDAAEDLEDQADDMRDEAYDIRARGLETLACCCHGSECGNLFSDCCADLSAPPHNSTYTPPCCESELSDCCGAGDYTAGSQDACMACLSLGDCEDIVANQIDKWDLDIDGINGDIGEIQNRISDILPVINTSTNEASGYCPVHPHYIEGWPPGENPCPISSGDACYAACTDPGNQQSAACMNCCYGYCYTPYRDYRCGVNWVGARYSPERGCDLPGFPCDDDCADPDMCPGQGTQPELYRCGLSVHRLRLIQKQGFLEDLKDDLEQAIIDLNNEDCCNDNNYTNLYVEDPEPHYVNCTDEDLEPQDIIQCAEAQQQCVSDIVEAIGGSAPPADPPTPQQCQQACSAAGDPCDPWYPDCWDCISFNTECDCYQNCIGGN